MKIIDKEYIDKNLIKSNGLNGAKLKNIDLTPEEIYIIYHGITKPKCICRKDRKFNNFVKGYRPSCGSNKCKNKQNKTIKMNITKEYIDKTLLNKNNTINAGRIKNLDTSVEELFLIYNECEAPICKCGEPCIFFSFSRGYSQVCSVKCSNNLEHKKKLLQKHNENQKTDKYKEYYKTLENQKTNVYFPSQRHILKYSEYNKMSWSNFFIGDKFNLESCMLYHNISRSLVNRNKKNWGISLENIRTYKNHNESELILLTKGVKTRKIISPYELDIYSEDYNFAIEYNGLMWHSQGVSEHSKFNTPNKDKKYHLMKTELCEEKGIQLFHIFENEWLDKRKKTIWISMIKGKQGLHTRLGARKCSIKEIPSKEAKEFLDENHMQGSVNGSIRIALVYNNDIVSLMTFGKARMSKKYEYELLRFCTKKNLTVQGAGSRLLKFFEENYKPKSLVSYANRRWSEGNFYEKAGFEFSHNSPPNMFWFKSGSMKLESRQKYQKHKLNDINGFIFDEVKTAKENMFLNNYRVIYDSGNKIYTKLC